MKSLKLILIQKSLMTIKMIQVLLGKEDTIKFINAIRIFSLEKNIKRRCVQLKFQKDQNNRKCTI